MKKLTLFITVSLILIIIAIMGFIILRPSISQDQSKRFNVIMIISDALRHDILGCYGGGASTPNIDWLAANGVTFKKAYSTAPCTVPSAVSMFTGKYSTSYGAVPVKRVKNNKIWKHYFYVPNKERLLGESLKELGYDLKMSIENPNALKSNNLQDFINLLQRVELTEKTIEFIEEITGITNTNWNKDNHLSSRYDECYGMLHYLLQYNEHEHFFLVKWFTDPHSPYNPPAKFRRKISIDPSKLSREETYYSSRAASTLKKLSEHELFYLKALYRAEVESIDERVGYIIEMLRYKNLLGKTYIIFTSDHGEMFGEHNRLSHGGVFYEELVHIPLIIFGPNIQAGSSVQIHISLLDLMPTIKDLLGVKYHDDFQGKSFSPLLFGDIIKDRILYFDQVSMKFSSRIKREDKALIMNGHKLIIREKRAGKFFFLYDLVNDLEETENLYQENSKLSDILYQEILKRIEENTRRRKKSAREMKKEIDFLKMREETIEELKTLGYIK